MILQGRLTYDIESCGEVHADGDGTSGVTGDPVIPFKDGKRCWVNRVIFGDRSARAWERSANPANRAVFAAGDSDTDVTFLRDANGLRLVINRNRAELQCYAYWNEDRRWLVNPMFIQPTPRRSELYPCSTRGCTAESGEAVPCRDEKETVIPDQEDRVF